MSSQANTAPGQAGGVQQADGSLGPLPPSLGANCPDSIRWALCPHRGTWMQQVYAVKDRRGLRAWCYALFDRLLPPGVNTVNFHDRADDLDAPPCPRPRTTGRSSVPRAAPGRDQGKI